MSWKPSKELQKVAEDEKKVNKALDEITRKGAQAYAESFDREMFEKEMIATPTICPNCGRDTKTVKTSNGFTEECSCGFIMVMQIE